MENNLPTSHKNTSLKGDWRAFVLALLALPAVTLGVTNQAQAFSMPADIDQTGRYSADFSAEPFMDMMDKDFNFENLSDEDFVYLPEDEFKGILTENDWNTLSAEQIDAKLKKAGKQPIGEPNDPLYKMTPAQVEKLTDAEWKKIEEKHIELYGDIDFDGEAANGVNIDDLDKNYFIAGAEEELLRKLRETISPDEDEFKGILTENDWNTLSAEQIDAKLKKAGKQPIGDQKDPLYTMTPAQIDKLTDAEWEKIEEKHIEIYGNEEIPEELKGIISAEDFDTLSEKQIDEKLKAAGKETFGDSRDPLYTMTPVQIDKLTDAEWEKIEEKHIELYGDEEFDDYDHDHEEFEDMEHLPEEDFEIEIKDIESEFKGIISEKDWDTLSAEQIDAKLKAAGKQPIGDARDPLYKMTPTQIDKLSESDWDKLMDKFFQIFNLNS